jgi:anti-sigma factor RsiW
MSNGQKTPECNMHEALVSYLYNEATADERVSVEGHLTRCAACKEELNSFERVRGMLQQWQLDDLPVVRVVAERASIDRSLLTVLKELLSVTPIWAKALGAVAMSVLVLAVLGTDVRVGKDGVSFHADLFRRGQAASPVAGSNVELPTANIEQVRAEVKGLVNQLIAESERQQRDDLKAQLVSLESQLNNMHSADLSKLATRIQEQQARLRTIERDIDRREGLDLTDILFSEVSRPGERSTTGGSD